jgi:hypothetical protein
VYDHNPAPDYTATFCSAAIAIIFTWTWLQWTRNTYMDYDNEAKTEVIWKKTSVTYAQFTCGVLMEMLSRSMWATSIRSQGIYSSHASRLLGLSSLEYFMSMHTVLFFAVSTLSNILIVYYGYLRYGGSNTGNTEWLSWGSERFVSHTTVYTRVIVFVCAVAIWTIPIAIGLLSTWSTGLVFLTYGIILTVYRSSSGKIYVLSKPLLIKLLSFDTILLVQLVSSAKARIPCIRVHTFPVINY